MNHSDPRPWPMEWQTWVVPPAMATTGMVIQGTL
jgi:hypothetical protein